MSQGFQKVSYDYSHCYEVCAGTSGVVTIPYGDTIRVFCLYESGAVAGDNGSVWVEEREGYDRWCFGLQDPKNKRYMDVMVDVMVVGGEVVDVLSVREDRAKDIEQMKLYFEIETPQDATVEQLENKALFKQMVDDDFRWMLCWFVVSMLDEMTEVLGHPETKHVPFKTKVKSSQK